MEEVIKIEGGRKLKGSVRISGSKNATVALIPASILATKGKVNIFGVPNISDVGHLSQLLRSLNVDVIQHDNEHLEIDPSAMVNIALDHPAVTKLRASYYFMGALLGRYKQVNMKMPGGCYLGPRPIDLHLKGFEALVEKYSGEQSKKAKQKEISGCTQSHVIAIDIEHITGKEAIEYIRAKQ